MTSRAAPPSPVEDGGEPGEETVLRRVLEVEGRRQEQRPAAEGEADAGLLDSVLDRRRA